MADPPVADHRARDIASGLMDTLFGADWHNFEWRANYHSRDLIATALTAYGDERFKEGLEAAAKDKDEAYRERNQVVAALAHIFPSGIARTDIPGWEPEWHGCVYLDLPTGQVSWHYHDREADLFADLPPYTQPWDGHDTPEKYRRLSAIRALAPKENE